MLKELWKIIDRLEIMNIHNMFDEDGKRVEMERIISALKKFVKENEEALK